MSGEPPTPTPTPGGPPAWVLKANEEFTYAALEAALAPTQKEGRDSLCRDLERYRQQVLLNDPGLEHVDFAFASLASGLAELAHKTAPEEWRATPDQPLMLVAEDQRTGARIADIDEELENDTDRGALAAMRYYTAHANDDRDAERALFRSVAEAGTEAMVAFLVILAETAAHNLLTDANFKGNLTGDVLTAWEARRALDPAPDPAPETFERGGHLWAKAATIPRGQQDEVMPHGLGIYIVGIYVPGPLPIERAAVGAHRQIRALAEDKGDDLCGIEHVEHVDAWRLPKDSRTQANRALRQAKREAGRPAELLRAWQHYAGHCPDAPPDPQDRTPGPDDIPLFEDPALATELAALTQETPR